MTGAANVLAEPLRGQVYREQASRHPGFADYQQKTTRPIPVIALDLQRPSSTNGTAVTHDLPNRTEPS